MPALNKLVITALLLALTLPGLANAVEWSDEVLEKFATLPLQDEGRVKPLDTFAQFTLLKLNGKRSFTPDEGERMNHLEWFLHCMFYPEQTTGWKHFIVDNSEVITAIGIETHGAKRDRFSYDELKAGREKLFEQAQAVTQKEANSRSGFETQILNLAENVLTYEKLIHYLDFAFTRFRVEGDTALAKAFPEADGVPFSEAIVRAPKVLDSLRGRGQELGEAAIDAEVKAFAKLMEEIDLAAQGAVMLAIFPPASAEEKVWMTPADVRSAAFVPGLVLGETPRLLAELEQLAVNKADAGKLAQHLNTLHGGIVGAATARGEYARIPLEVHYYDAKYLWYSLYLYVLSFILIAISWLLPHKRWTHLTTLISVALPTILLIIGITLRCIIRARPPVSTLYETVLFITAVAVTLAIIIEIMNRQRIAIAVASLLGVMGMFLAFRYEAKEGVDTMPALIAVLDTNFWLSTHVTTVTVGYAAGLLAGAIGHIYVLGKLVGWKRRDRIFYRSVSRMAYGTMCFSLLFATVGTILGGIWANDSWGRFWGWDPKENGALMIVLWSLVVLHARMGRYIGELGVCVSSIILGCIVAFSWWGVNNLGVGLHSYGFTSGLWVALGAFWAVESLVCLLGGIVWFRERQPEPIETTGEPQKLPGRKKPKPA